MEQVEYRAVIRFLYLKGRTPTEAFDEMKEVYDVVKHWHRQFKFGRKSVETAPIPWRIQSAIDDATIRQVETAILDDRCITTRQLAHEVKISVGSVEKIIHDHLHISWMDSTVIHSFPETRTSRVLRSSFDHVPRQPGGLF